MIVLEISDIVSLVERREVGGRTQRAMSAIRLEVQRLDRHDSLKFRPSLFCPPVWPTA